MTCHFPVRFVTVPKAISVFQTAADKAARAAAEEKAAKRKEEEEEKLKLLKKHHQQEKAKRRKKKESYATLVQKAEEQLGQVCVVYLPRSCHILAMWAVSASSSHSD